MWPSLCGILLNTGFCHSCAYSHHPTSCSRLLPVQMPVILATVHHVKCFPETCAWTAAHWTLKSSLWLICNQRVLGMDECLVSVPIQRPRLTAFGSGSCLVSYTEVIRLRKTYPLIWTHVKLNDRWKSIYSLIQEKQNLNNFFSNRNVYLWSQIII